MNNIDYICEAKNNSWLPVAVVSLMFQHDTDWGNTDLSVPDWASWGHFWFFWPQKTKLSFDSTAFSYWDTDTVPSLYILRLNKYSKILNSWIGFGSNQMVTIFDLIQSFKIIWMV